jgi:hypothetical protein
MSTNRIPRSKRWLAAAALTGTAVAVAGAVHPAWGASGGLPATGRFTLIAHHGSDTSIDAGASGFSAGDQDLMVSPLTHAGAHVGSLVGECTDARVTATAVDQLCDFTLRLRGGQIIASGAVHAGQQGPGTFTLAVLGGTGRYVGASGTLAVTATNGPTVPLTLTLR